MRHSLIVLGLLLLAAAPASAQPAAASAGLFRSPRVVPRDLDQLYLVPTLLPLPSGEQGSFSPEGSQIASSPISQWRPAWKGYRGGQTALLNGDQSMATITPVIIGGAAPTTFMPSGTPLANGLGGITGLDDTGEDGNGISSVPADVYDKNFGPNYSIVYSGENAPGGVDYEGGLGADQYSGYQGDPGNFAGIADNYNVAAVIQINNDIGGEAAASQYQVAQETNGGSIYGIAQGAQQFEVIAGQDAANAPANGGGDPVLGAQELIGSNLGELVAGVAGFLLVIAGIAATIVSTTAAVVTAAVVVAISGAVGAAYIVVDALNKIDGLDTSSPGQYYPHDANTQTFLNDVGRVAGQAYQDVATWFSYLGVHPVSSVPFGQTVAAGTSPATVAAPLSAVGGAFSTNASGQPIFTVPSVPATAAALPSAAPAASTSPAPAGALASPLVAAAKALASAPASSTQALLAMAGSKTATVAAPAMPSYAFKPPAATGLLGSAMAAGAHASSSTLAALPLHLMHA